MDQKKENTLKFYSEAHTHNYIETNYSPSKKIILLITRNLLSTKEIYIMLTMLHTYCRIY